MVKELHGDHKSLNWEQATFPFQMVQMADKWRLLTIITVLTGMILQAPLRFAWFHTQTPLHRKALIAMAHLRKTGVHGKGVGVSLIEADMPLGMPREAGFINGVPGAHNGLFGLALNSWKLRFHRKFAEEYSLEPNLHYYCVSMGLFFEGNLVGNFQGWKLFRILKGQKKPQKFEIGSRCPTFVGSRAGLSGKVSVGRRVVFFLEKKTSHHPFTEENPTKLLLDHYLESVIWKDSHFLMLS